MGTCEIYGKSFFYISLFGYDFTIETDAPELMTTCLDVCYGMSQARVEREPDESLFRLSVLHWDGLDEDGTEKERIRLESPDGKAILKWDGVTGRGRVILPPPADPDSLRLVFSAVAAFVQCALKSKGVFFIHASAVGSDKGAVLFAGPNNCGKSTLMRAMLERGGVYLADDAAPVKIGIDGCEILASEETVSATGLPEEEVGRLIAENGFIRSRDTRFLVPPAGRKSCTPLAIFFPEAADENSGPFILPRKEALLRILRLIKTPLSDADAEVWFSMADKLSRQARAARIAISRGSLFPVEKVVEFCDVI